MKLAPLVCALSFTMVLHSLTAPTQLRHMSRATLEDKIRGGWAGQMIGVSYGAATEFKAMGEIIEWELPWTPDMIDNAIHQDDLYVEMTFAHVMDRIGLDATMADYGEAFKNSQYHLWHANAAARRLLNQGIQPPWTGHPKYNLHANDIDFQIEADFIGLMSPGLPQVSNHFCDRIGRVMNHGDGLYGGMFVAGMYAAAYFEPDLRQVVEAGLACIPAGSEYGLLIRDVLDWSAQQPDDWRQVWHRIEAKWNKNDPCPDGALAAFNIDAKLNGGYIAMGLLYGRGDFHKTMEISTRCGQDSDCNPSNAAGILGVILGYSAIPAEFTANIPSLADKKFSYTDYSFNEICASTLKRALLLIEQNGGKVTEHDIYLPLQKPKAPILEQWNPGVPDRRIGTGDPAWTWTGQWTDEKEAKVSRAAGDEAILEFTGVAVALLGRLSQEGGRADVYLDGEKVGTFDAYIVPRTHDNALWHIDDLESGPHTLRIVTTGTSDARSTGRTVPIERAIVYR